MLTTFARFRTLKWRITLVVVLLVVLAAALVTLVSLQLAARQMRAVVGDQQFAMLSSAAAYIDQDLQGKQAVLKVIGEQAAQGDYVAPMALQTFLEGYPSLREQFFNVVAFDARGDLIVNLRDRRQIGSANFSKRAYFNDTINNREGLISAPFRSTLSNKPVVLITEPVFDASGKLLYIIGGALDLTRPQFFGQLDALKLGASGYLFTLTRQGTLIHHPDKSRLLLNVRTEAGAKVPSTLAALDGFEGWVEGRSKAGVPALLAYKQLRHVEWIVGAVYPVDEAFAPLIDMRRHALIGSALVALAAGAIGWLAILRLLRPLGALRRHVARVSDGSSDIEVFDVARRDEFGELSRAFYLLSQQRRDAEHTLTALTRTDPLTGIYNRRMFEEVFSTALARARRTGRQLALAYLDIDRFKRINDTHGHGVGDLVLIEFARRLQLAVRETDTVARLAGDEFVVVFEQLGNDAEVTLLAQKIMGSVAPPFELGELTLTVTTSIGIAVSADGGASVAALMEASDQALYAAKNAGRNGYAVRAVGQAAPL